MQSMMSNSAGMSYIFFSVVGEDVLPVHKFCDEEADDGLLLRHKRIAKVCGVLVEHM